MKKQSVNNIQLGAFVLAGLFFLIVLLYLIGKNMSLFGDTYVLKARFSNIQGLVAGNNIRFSGIEAGTVKDITVLNDTTIEVTMYVQKKLQAVIRSNAIVSIGNEGLVGNKVVNIIPARKPGQLAVEGDVLFSGSAVSTEEMLQILYTTNKDVAVIAANLKIAVQRINNSSMLWSLLEEKSIPINLKSTLVNVRTATARLGLMVNNMNDIVMDVKNGKGSLGEFIRDSGMAKNVNEVLFTIKNMGMGIDSISKELYATVKEIKQDISSGSGPAKALLKDSLMVNKLHVSLDNIAKGTDGFNQNMEALKHSYFFRGYFKKLANQKKKDSVSLFNEKR